MTVAIVVTAHMLVGPAGERPATTGAELQKGGGAAPAAQGRHPGQSLLPGSTTWRGGHRWESRRTQARCDSAWQPTAACRWRDVAAGSLAAACDQQTVSAHPTRLQHQGRLRCCGRGSPQKHACSMCAAKASLPQEGLCNQPHQQPSSVTPQTNTNAFAGTGILTPPAAM